MKRYNEEDYLMISGIQHFSFCRRQWALIHIEQQWEDNYRTVDGSIMHEHAHDDGVREKRGDKIITRGMHISSPLLGFSGECDVVEFTRAEHGIILSGQTGLWTVTPVEYKRGKPKTNLSDKLQVAAQVMCLEHMLGCDIPAGYLYYGEIRRRVKIPVNRELRDATEQVADEMHAYVRRGYTPKAKKTRACNACSLKSICLPFMDRTGAASAYINSRIMENDDEETS